MTAMWLTKKDLPNIISYFENEASSITDPYKVELLLIIDKLKHEFIEFVYDKWFEEEEDNLLKSYEERLAYKGLSINNGEYMDEYPDYCYSEFISELSWAEGLDTYDLVVEAVNLQTFNI